MRDSAVKYHILLLVGVGLLMGETCVQAQSADAAKRSFAELLARRERQSVAKERRVIDARFAARRGVTKSHPTLTSRPLVEASRFTSSGFHGLVSATPINPSGNGPGRDVFVETMYFETFGREPTQRELDHLTRRLGRTVSTITLATYLWDSPEHRMMMRSSPQDPHSVTFLEAYRIAYARGLAARSKP